MRAPPNQTNIMHITYSVPSVESLKLLTIIEAEMDQNGKRSYCATSYQIICYIGARITNDLYRNRKIDSFDND